MSDAAQKEKTWGGYRWGRKRQSSIRVVQLHVAIKAQTRAVLGAKAEEKGLTIGELIDILANNSEQTAK